LGSNGHSGFMVLGLSRSSRGTSLFTSSTSTANRIRQRRLLKMTGSLPFTRKFIAPQVPAIVGPHHPHHSARIVTQMEICASPSKSPVRLLPPAWSQLCPPRPHDSVRNGTVLGQRQFQQIVRAEGGNFRATCNLLSRNRGRDRGAFSGRGPD
jgi:hypothetical protein